MRVVMSNDGLGIANVYGRLVGQFLGNSYTNLLAPLWKSFPELEPESMKGVYVEPTASLSPASQTAIRAALEDAKAAIAYAKANIPESGQEQLFRFDGLSEIEATVDAIEAFLRTPRFRDDEKSAV